MSGIKVMLSLLVFVAGSAGPSARAGSLPSCAGQLRGFNAYELMENEGIVEKFSVFEITNWSDASAFQGVVAPAGKNLSLEVELKGGEKTYRQGTFSFAPWEKDDSLAVAEGFQAKKFFKRAEPGMAFKLRLKENGKPVCEETKEIGGD
jgi:hypothetical protein